MTKRQNRPTTRRGRTSDGQRMEPIEIQVNSLEELDEALRLLELESLNAVQREDYSLEEQEVSYVQMLDDEPRLRALLRSELMAKRRKEQKERQDSTSNAAERKVTL